MAQTSSLSTKFLKIRHFALLVLSFFLKASAMNGTDLNLAFQDPFNSYQHQSSVSSEDLLDSSISRLSRLQKIYQFDKGILLENADPGELDFSHLSLSDALLLLRFYSEDGSTRSYTFEADIKRPLLDIISTAVEASPKFPQVLKYLKEPSVSSAPLTSEAIKHIFQHPTKGLTALHQALISLKANKKLTAVEKANLRLFEKLAGFFYDKQALDFLVKLNQKALPPSLDMTLVDNRITLLKIIHVHGEIFKLMRPSTLNLGAELPNDGVLENLRDVLSHLSGQKMGALFSAEADILQLFTDLYKDTQHLNTLLQTVKIQYEADHNKPTPSDLWRYIDSLPDIRNAPPPVYAYNGIQGLLTLLTPPQAEVIFNELRRYQEEIGDLHKAKKREEAEGKQNERDEWINQIINELMVVDETGYAQMTANR